MIFKSSSPLSPYTTLRIGGVEVNYNSIVGAELMLEENKHDLLIIKFVGVPPHLLNQYLNAPVIFNLDSGPRRTQLFTGYVSSVEPVAQSNVGLVNKSPFQEVQVYCIGASYYMKVTNSKVWNPPTLNNIVSSISKTYGFSASFPKSTYVPVNLTQAAESDWAFLVKTVNKYSYRVSVHGTHIHVWDTYSATGRTASYHDLLGPKVHAGSQPCTIIKFEGTFGSLSPSGYSSSVAVSYIDNQGATLGVSSRDLKTTSGLGKSYPAQFENFIGSSTQSYEDAQNELLRLKKNNMPFAARTQITAGAGIVPGGVVNVMNYGTEFDGLWYVKAVKHSLYKNHYITELDITKDALYTQNHDIKPVTKFVDPPQPTIIAGRWVAATRKVDEYV